MRYRWQVFPSLSSAGRNLFSRRFTPFSVRKALNFMDGFVVCKLMCGLAKGVETRVVVACVCVCV